MSAAESHVDDPNRRAGGIEQALNVPPIAGDHVCRTRSSGCSDNGINDIRDARQAEQPAGLMGLLLSQFDHSAATNQSSQLDLPR